MGRLVTNGDLAIFEYPAGANEPTFTLDEKGVLWIEGYNIPLWPGANPVRAMKRFDTNLSGYVLIGSYSDAKKKIVGDFSEVIKEAQIDINNSVFLMRPTFTP